uniref:Uncharacterized protein n=1 Tax=Anopheles culicifacies TaxID=139723 RepID=A0A182MVD8_9DIPT
MGPRIGMKPGVEMAPRSEDTTEEFLAEVLESEEDANMTLTSQDACTETQPSSSQPSASRPKRATDSALSEDLRLAMQKERHKMVKEQKSGNYYAMVSWVTVMDQLDLAEQIKVRDEIFRFGHRVLKEKVDNKVVKDSCKNH